MIIIIFFIYFNFDLLLESKYLKIINEYLFQY